MLVQKSVRLDEKLLAYIDCEPGNTFSAKLTGLLDAYFNEEAYKYLMNRVARLEEDNTRLRMQLSSCKDDLSHIVVLLNTLICQD